MNFEDAALKVLGLRWNPEVDCFIFLVKTNPAMKYTKRVLLSELAKVYDPLGFLALVTFYTKYLIQQLWLAAVSWDETPSTIIVRAWQQYQDQLPVL